MSDETFSAPRAVYVHVPFCRHRCGYCDFPLIAGRDDLIDSYLRAVDMEMRTVGVRPEIDTLFFGGGTPTHLSPGQLTTLMASVIDAFELAPGAEFSVEANPLDLTQDKIEVLAESGVNRVSLGAQSFDAEALTVLERDHHPDEISAVVGRLSDQGLRCRSLDLIFGVPGQSLQSWQRTLDAAINLGVEHLSTYGLTYEKGTAFWKRRAARILSAVDDETERAMYALAMDRLPAAGFEQYELSNFARRGFQCRHNQVYWRGDSYYAFGPGAARYVDGVRSTNYRSVTTWLQKVLAGQSGVAESEELTLEQRARELIMLGFRQIQGIDLEAFIGRTGYRLRDLAPSAFDRFLDDGLLEQRDGFVRLSLEGRFLADSVIAEFL